MAELRDFGWNLSTYSFFGISFFALLGAWGLKQQINEIRHGRTGKAVSVIWFAVSAGMFSMFFVYGIEEYRFAPVAQGLLRVPFIVVILSDLKKFKGFSKRDRFVTASVAGLVLCGLFPQNTMYVLVLLSYTSIVSSLFQPWEIWKAKTSGEVSIRLLVIYQASVLFWTAYGYAARDSLIIAVSAPYAIIYLVTIGLWIRYRKI